MPETTRRPSSYPYWHISALCWPIAILAYAAAAGLLTGAIDLGAESDDRLIADSPILAGIVVLAVVAVPMTLAAHQAGTRKHSSARTAFTAGVLLVALIAIQSVVVREFVVLQLLFVLTGVVVSVLGYRAMSFPRGSQFTVSQQRDMA